MGCDNYYLNKPVEYKGFWSVGSFISIKCNDNILSLLKNHKCECFTPDKTGYMVNSVEWLEISSVYMCMLCFENKFKEEVVDLNPKLKEIYTFCN